MSKYIPGNHKHLTLEDRIYMENSLSKGCTFKDIAKYLCKDPTTISKEVRAHRLSDWYHKGTFYNAKNFCVHRYHCKKTNACRKILLCGIKCASCPTCNQTCPDFERERCVRLDKAPYVCNGCDKITDRGSEFGDPETLETGAAGIRRTSIYYCDPMRSGQKGGVENAHTMLRMVLPKGTSFAYLTQWDVNLIVNHINSTPRKSLDGKTPYDAALESFGEATLKAFQLKRISPDEVHLTPKLIRFNH